MLIKKTIFLALLLTLTISACGGQPTAQFEEISTMIEAEPTIIPPTQTPEIIPSPTEESASPPPAEPTEPDCALISTGDALPFENAAADYPLDIGAWGDTIAIEIIGHSENQGYDTFLQKMLDENSIAGKKFIVNNHWIGGHETWKWVTPREKGYEAIERILAEKQYPTIALVLTSNNATYPIAATNMGDPNFARFVSETEQLADHLYNEGQGAEMFFFSSHRYKPKNMLPAFNELFGIAEMLANAEDAEKSYIQTGPEQHDLSRCHYPESYAPDNAHTNAEGDRLMAEAWYNFLKTALTGESVATSTEEKSDAAPEEPSTAPIWENDFNGQSLRLDGTQSGVSTTPPAEVANLDYGTIYIRFKYEEITNTGVVADSLPLFYFGRDESNTALNGNNDLTIYIGHGKLNNPEKRQIYFTIHENEKVALCFDSGKVSLEAGQIYEYIVATGENDHRAYLNGETLNLSYNAGTGPADYNYFSSVPEQDVFNIGRGSYGITGEWWNFNGAIEEIMIFDRSLGDAEIVDLWK